METKKKMFISTPVHRVIKYETMFLFFYCLCRKLVNATVMSLFNFQTRMNLIIAMEIYCTYVLPKLNHQIIFPYSHC